uniref:Uncharacterized protein n=1 Tax=Arundo donax TaxID=35708 RepID=A0A0A8ZLN9_ARUDO
MWSLKAHTRPSKLCAHWDWKYKKYMHVGTTVCCFAKSMKTWKNVSFAVHRDTRGPVMRVSIPMKVKRKDPRQGGVIFSCNPPIEALFLQTRSMLK